MKSVRLALWLHRNGKVVLDGPDGRHVGVSEREVVRQAREAYRRLKPTEPPVSPEAPP